MRRRTTAPLRLAAVGASALLLAGCAQGGAAETLASGEPLLPAAEGATGYPFALETEWGSTTLEERPERIAVITPSTIDTDAVFALGGVPVLAPSTVERNPWLEPLGVDGVETLWDSAVDAEASPEVVAASAPDLIVNLAADEAFGQDRYDALSAIAPVLHGAELSWQEVTLALGEAVDLPGAAQDVVDRATATVEAARSEHPEFAGASAAHVIVYEEEYGAAYASYPGSDTAALFEQLGFVLPEAAHRFADDGAIGLENAGLIDADLLLLSTFGDASDYFVDAPLVQAVPAVAQGRAVLDDADPVTGTNSFAWALNVQSAVSVPWLIERLEGFGAEALG